MLRLFRSRRAQNTAEYAIMIVIVIGVFAAMQLYIRRGLQARLKMGADNIPRAIIGEARICATGLNQDILGNATFTQYEPYYTAKGMQNMEQATKEGTEVGAITSLGGMRNLVNATSSRTGYQTMVGTANAD
jgi:hypothetical protein